MIRIKEAILVEGKYDKIKLDNIVDTTIVVTNGFGLYKNDGFCSMLKKLSESCGLIILTDSDRAGFQIRNYITSKLGANNIKQAYIPQIEGKEKRKTEYSKEKTLGVEGLSEEIILNALRNCKASFLDENTDRSVKQRLTAYELLEDGIIGQNSAKKRSELLKKLSLPVNLSTKRLINVLCDIMTKEEYKETVKNL